MKILGVIPARYGSTRFPGKALVSLHGKPLVQWVIEAAQKSKKLSEIIVATDDERIFKVAEGLSVTAVMTDPQLPSGTDRAYAASHGRGADVIVNIQGDEPLINPEHIDLQRSAIKALLQKLDEPMSPSEALVFFQRPKSVNQYALD